MQAVYLRSGDSLVVARRPEPILRAFAVAGALDIGVPTAQMINWLARQTPEYDNTFGYWQPYGLLLDGSIFVHSWARGAFSYFANMAGVSADILSVDPAVWYHNVVQRVTDCGADDWTASAARMAQDQTDPEWSNGAVGEFYKSVRTAISRNNVLTTPDQIRRRRKTMAKHAAEVKAWKSEQAQKFGLQPSDLDT